ncbi:BMC domain-containing protein [Cetobacterium sp.]|uniref:BMC domain-containing protein n=1 Tax=Cetobacterium sp. TaxID=2071632 RepID=UPI002FC745FE
MKSIGVAEFNNIPTGVEQLDKVLKNVDVDVYRGGTTCPGKYYFIVYGEVEAVNQGMALIKGSNRTEIISGVAPEIIQALNKKNVESKFSTIGVFEFYGIPEGVKALDLVIKSVEVCVLKLILGWTLAGKSYFVIGGDTSSVEEAVVLVTGSFKIRDVKVINNPSKDLLVFI